MRQLTVRESVKNVSVMIRIWGSDKWHLSTMVHIIFHQFAHFIIFLPLPSILFSHVFYCIQLFHLSQTTYEYFINWMLIVTFPFTSMTIQDRLYCGCAMWVRNENLGFNNIILPICIKSPDSFWSSVCCSH